MWRTSFSSLVNATTSFLYTFRNACKRLLNLSTLLSQCTGTSGPVWTMCIVDFKARAPEVFKDTTGIKGITEGKRMPSWIASYAWKSRSPSILEKNFWIERRNKSVPSPSGTYRQTSSTASFNTSCTRLVPFGAFIAYFVTYCTTAHKFKQGRQSTLPKFASRICSS